MSTKHKLQIAHKVRKQVEKFANSYPDHRYKNMGLGGLCALASVALHTEFVKHGYDSKVVYGCFKSVWGGHCFVESAGVIWDITATQFNFFPNIQELHWECKQPVWFHSKKHERFKKFYEPLYSSSLYQTMKDDFMFFNDWPKLEQPSVANLKKVQSL